MAYEHLITADWHDMDVWSAYDSGGGGSHTRSSATARTGTYSFFLGNGGYNQLNVAGGATYYVGCGFFTNASNWNAIYLSFREGPTSHVTILLNMSSGIVQALRGTTGGTVLGSGGSVSTNRWYYIGAKVTVSDTVGVVQVYLDGTEIFNLTSQDTQNGGTAWIDNLLFCSTGVNGYIDDIKVRDNAIPGVGGIYVYVPTGDGADTGWAASAGSRYQCVDEAPGTYTDYVSTDVSTTGTKSTFTHAAMAAAAYDSIDCVCAAAVAKLDASGSGNSRAIVKSSASYGNGTTVALSTTSKYLHSFQTVDPNGGGAWSKTAVGSAEPGVETI